MTSGLVIGKFLPFHNGHKLLLEVAENNCDNLTVVIGYKNSDEYDISLRVKWIKELFPAANVFTLHDKINTDYDVDNIATSEEFWNYWISNILKNLNCVDKVFASELYGKELARRLSAEFIPVDIDRSTTDYISGTNTRDGWPHTLHNVPSIVRRDLCKKVAIMGPESSGKSTTARILADLFSGGLVCEYGRILSEYKQNQLTADDFICIAKTQNILTINAAEQNHIIFCDTETFTTKLFAEIYLPDNDVVNEIMKYNKITYDLYLLMTPEVAWVNDGQRVISGLQDRQVFFDKCLAYLQSINANYVVISGNDYQNRYDQVDKAVEYILTHRG